MRTYLRPISAAFMILFLPFALNAAVEPDVNYFTDLISDISLLIDELLPLVMGLALLFFLWGIFQFFIFGAGNEESRETGKKYMIYALAGLALMVGVWGFVGLIINILGVDTGFRPSVPGAPF